MTDYRLDPDGPRTSDYAQQVGEALAESVRVLNHITRSPDAVPNPNTIYTLLGHAHAAIAGFDQLLRQLTERLDAMHADDLVHHDSDIPARAAYAVTATAGTLDHCRALAGSLAGGLASAHAHTAALYLGMPVDEEDT
ncbi:hypothetical protein [Nonomuraea turcica]|uniref:hypothetical protein n=1 Tax=Nonomuraea sp. G32 TaxID=3067274 RepID=UPI00273A7D6B|nr:hypothetical protein [Nonomuraea sp. G32]MDP4501005.1 hypothetical protein [Nonomuraea sp. G32]